MKVGGETEENIDRWSTIGKKQCNQEERLSDKYMKE